jgi:antitoxin YobK
MSYKDYKKAVELIAKNKDIADSEQFPQSAADVKKAEDILSVKLPKSYKDFLSTYGIFISDTTYIYGFKSINFDNYLHSNIISRTLDERKVNQDPCFPLSFIPIYDLGNGELFCLDTSKFNEEDECPMVCWSFGNIDSIDDDFGKDFGEFFLNMIIKGLKNKEEEGRIINW